MSVSAKVTAVELCQCFLTACPPALSKKGDSERDGSEIEIITRQMFARRKFPYEAFPFITAMFFDLQQGLGAALIYSDAYVSFLLFK